MKKLTEVKSRSINRLEKKFGVIITCDHGYNYKAVFPMGKSRQYFIWQPMRLKELADFLETYIKEVK
jgi:hypothetical protein